MKLLDLSLFNWNSDIFHHIIVLYYYALGMNASEILELGVRTGESTKAFIEACKITGGTLTSVDINYPPKLSEFERWHFIKGNDLDINFDGKRFDIIFVDTSHKYNHTLSELEKFTPLLKNGGIMFLHDTDPELIGFLRGHSVREAIGTFLSRHKEYEFKDFNWGYGMGMIKRK